MNVANDETIQAISKIVELAMEGAVAVDQAMDRAKAHNRAKMIECGMDADQIAEAEEFFETQREEARATTTRRIVSESLEFWAKQTGAEKIIFFALAKEYA